MLTFSRKQVVQKRIIQVHHQVKGAETMLARIIGEDYKLVTRCGENLPPVCADPGQLEQVMMNLVLNARDAMPNGGTIVLATTTVDSARYTVPIIGGGKAEGTYVAVTVRDSGTGIDPAVQAKIFEPFFSTKGADGTGLGLSVVYGIVEEHEGGVNVESRAGQGSAFTVFLPAVEDLEKGNSENGKLKTCGEIARGGGERVLLIEDEAAVIQFVGQALRQNGYEIVSAMTCAEAREVFARERGRFDMVFTDAVLPDGNGVELLDEFLRTNPALPALLSSGYTDKDSLVELAKQRQITFLQKPYSLPELMQTVYDVVSAEAVPVQLT
jgi:CheY-like chemotaxis protein